MRLIKFLLIFMIWISASATWAMDCRLAQMLNHPEIAGNQEFWQEFSKLKRGDDRAVEALVRKHSPNAANFSNSAAPASGLTNSAFSLSNKAEKAQSKLSPINQKHFDEFIKTVNEKGVRGLYDQPKKWHFEKLRMNGDLHTIRLDGANRVLFEIRNGAVHILDIGNHITH